MTAEDMITGSLRLLGVYGAGDPVEDNDLDDGLIVLNELFDDWNAQHLIIYTIISDLLPLTASTPWYTMGPGGSFDKPRPVKIVTAGIVEANNVRSDLKIDTVPEFNQIPEKSIEGKLPLRFVSDNAYPLALLRLWPIPSESCSLDLSWWGALEEPLALDTELSLPPAYRRAIRYNLAVAIAPEYGRDPGAVVTGIAQQSKAEVAALNASNFAGTEDPPQAAA